MKQFKAFTIIYSLVGIVLLGTVFFRIVEGWSWLDSYFFTVVSISTVGYGELVPATALGKIGATGFIFVGLGIFAVAIQQFALYHMRKREEHAEWLFARLGNGSGASGEPANEDDPPNPPSPPEAPDYPKP
ncbi:potassium channel family protein [Primorskyibacter sp. S87]|uniref:potassium channel family protein n=1 Tax=Primorskyibacter sp. S87 TaxID=3415126 RepID=UPI003C7BCF2D